MTSSAGTDARGAGWLARWWPLLAGVALVVVGLAVAALHALFAPPTASFGWFAYEPVAQARFAPPLILYSWADFTGAGLILAGLLVTVAAVAYRAGRARAGR